MTSTSTLNLYSKSSEIYWPSTTDGQYAKHYLSPILDQGVNRHFPNIQTELRVLQIGETMLPVTLNETEYKNSYVCSPYGQFVKYAPQGIKQMGLPWLHPLIVPALSPIALAFRLAKLNRVVAVNNWLLSTNLYPRLEAESVGAITDLLSTTFPRHAILFRSLTQRQNPEILENLVRTGYQLIPSRAIYLVHPEEDAPYRCRMVKSDQKILRQTDYEVLEHGAIPEEAAPRICELYRLLNIDKYSDLNPIYSEDFIKHCLRHRLLSFRALQKGGRIDAVVGGYSRNGVMTSPLFGYDTTLPQELGLYRMISQLLLDSAKEEGTLLNQSAGAGKFKSLRRGKSEIEYLAVYTRHLSARRRAAWNSLEYGVNRFGKGLMDKF